MSEPLDDPDGIVGHPWEEEGNPFERRRGYQVGYGRPPAEHRFKKGNQAARGKGKGRKRKRVDEILSKIAQERCEVVLRGRRITMTRMEALFRQEFERAMKSSRSAARIIALLRELDDLPAIVLEEQKITIEFVNKPPNGLPASVNDAADCETQVIIPRPALPQSKNQS